MAVFLSAEVVDEAVLTVSAEQNTLILVNGRIILIKENTVLSGPPTKRYRKRPLEMDGQENVFSE